MRSEKWHRCPHCRTINPGQAGPDFNCSACRQRTRCPCPACGGLLTDHSAICPHCRQAISWRGNYPQSNATALFDRQANQHATAADDAAYELSIESLPPELARKLIQRHNASISNAENQNVAARAPIVLRRLKNLSPDLAGELRYALGSIHLPDVSNVRAEAARRFATHTSGLHFDGLIDLTPDVAAALAKHTGRLSFGNLETISAEAATALQKHTGTLALHGIKWLGDRAAKALSLHTGRLELDRLDEAVTQPCLQARHYSRNNELRPFTSSLTTITADFAALLRTFHGRLPLVLDGLRHLDATVARELTGEAAALSLNGLQEITPETATELGRFPGQLLLNGIERVTDTIMRLLTQGPAPPQRLSMRGLCKMPTEWFPKAGGTEWNLHLFGLAVPSVDSARQLADFPGKLHVDHGNWMSVEVLEVFQDGSSRLVIHDIESVPADVRAKIKASRNTRVSFPPPKSELAHALDRIRLTTSPAAASETIHLQSTNRLTWQAAYQLTQWPGTIVFHQDIRLDAKTARALAGGRSNLEFRNVSELQSVALHQLIQHRGDMTVFGRYEILPHHVTILAEKATGNLSIDPVCAMSLPAEQQAVLNANPRIRFKFTPGFDGG